MADRKASDGEATKMANNQAVYDEDAVPEPPEQVLYNEGPGWRVPVLNPRHPDQGKERPCPPKGVKKYNWPGDPPLWEWERRLLGKRWEPEKKDSPTEYNSDKAVITLHDLPKRYNIMAPNYGHEFIDMPDNKRLRIYCIGGDIVNTVFYGC